MSWPEVPAGPTSGPASPLPPPCWDAAWCWLQLTDLDGRVRAEALLKLLHQGLHWLLRRLSRRYRVGNGAEVRAWPTLSLWRIGLGSPHPLCLELPPRPSDDAGVMETRRDESAILHIYWCDTYSVFKGTAPMPLRYDGEHHPWFKESTLGRTHIQALPTQCNTPVIGEYRVMGEGRSAHPP